jgi:hypoxanthine phosphoribosyltransferase
VSELGAEIARDYEGRDPILVASLKTSVFFLADLSRAIPIAHAIDFIALAGYMGRTRQSGVRLIKDLDVSISGRDVLLVEDVVDTGLTLNYVCRTLSLREPASLNAVTFLDRPYRRLVDDLPVRYVGFTVPDEFFVGYGFDLDERYRHLPDLHFARGASYLRLISRRRPRNSSKRSAPIWPAHAASISPTASRMTPIASTPRGVSSTRFDRWSSGSGRRTR